MASPAQRVNKRWSRHRNWYGPKYQFGWVNWGMNRGHTLAGEPIYKFLRMTSYRRF